MSDPITSDNKRHTRTPYKLHPNDERIVRALAKKSHKPCSGTGIVGWMDEGYEALLCSCVRRKAERLEPALERVHANLAQEFRKRKLRYRVVDALIALWHLVILKAWRQHRTDRKLYESMRCFGWPEWHQTVAVTGDKLGGLWTGTCPMCEREFTEVPGSIKRSDLRCGPLFVKSPLGQAVLARLKLQAPPADTCVIAE